MIEVSGLTKSYGEVTALSEVTFTVEKGQIVGFLGANGAGKTTTMDILCGCLGADEGRAKLNGIDITENPQKAKSGLGYLPDEPPLYNDMRVEEFISYAAKLHKVLHSNLSEKVEKVINQLSLSEVRTRLVGNLSKGYKQRVALAQALVHEPEILVLDEPTEGLDPNQIVQIRELIRSLAGKHTILLSSHILSEVENTCDHIIIIHQGKVIQQGTYEELVKKIESGGQYTLEVARNADKLIKELNNIEEVSSIKLSTVGSNKIDFYAKNPDAVLDSVARKVLDGGYGLKELASNSKSLEDIYFQLTQ